MTPHTVYYNEAPVDQSDYPAIAQQFKIPYEVVFRCVEALEKTGEVPIMAFSGPTRERVRALAMALGTESPEVTSDAPDTISEQPEEIVYDSATETLGESDFAEAFTIVQRCDKTDESFEPKDLTESDEVVNHAATGLMSAFSDSDGCFIVSDDGCCRINPDKPPSLNQSLVVVSNVLKLKDLGNVIDDKSSWMLGSIIASLEDFHGENFSVTQVCDATTKAYNTVATAVGVFRAFPTRYKLSFSSHKEAHYAKIRKAPSENLASQKLILSKAESHKLGPKLIRALCSIAKTMEDDTVIKNIRSQKQAMDLIEAYREAKVVYIVYNEGEWTRVTGLAGEPPEGKMVIDTKNWTAQTGNQIVQIMKRAAPTQ